MKHRIFEASIIAVGIILLGVFVKLGIDDFVNKDRKVTVKGLSEKEVKADKVTWTIVSKEVGNNLSELYNRMAEKQAIIKRFLLREGIKEKEISENAPKVLDLKADRYASSTVTYRYNIKSTITVTSSNVDLVRAIIARQGDLLKQGVAILEGDYSDNPIVYDYTAFNDKKTEMMEEAIANAQKTAFQFAKNSHSKIDKIISADQGQFSIDNRDENTPYIKKIRVVTTITYSLKN